MEEYFHREWVRHLFGQAVAALKERCEREGKPQHFALFERYDLEGPDATELVSRIAGDVLTSFRILL